MTAHERLRQLHATHPRVLPIFRKTGSVVEGADAFERARDIETLADALPQFANLAEAADTIRESHNDLLVIGRDDDNHYCVLCGQRNGGHWDNCPYRTITRALTDLEQALNPTRNTQ